MMFVMYRRRFSVSTASRSTSTGKRCASLETSSFGRYAIFSQTSLETTRKTVSWSFTKSYKNNFTVVKAVLTNLGFELWRVFIPSRKNAFAGNRAYYVQNGVKDELMTDEYACTTLGVIVWLAVWSRSR